MDSFYGAPRRPPPPPVINPIARVPAVPEVSIFENSFFGAPKNFNSCGFKGHNVCDSSFFAKKQVRFRNPQPQTLKTVPDLNGKTFKQIYMANVPDRHLDLSIFEPPLEKRPEENFTSHFNKQTDVINKCNTSSNEMRSLRSIENHPTFRHTIKSPTKFTEISTQTDKKCTDLTIHNDEPTIKDLYKIIQQQNEQIMMLQRQVNNLKSTIRQPAIESPNCDLPIDRPFMKEFNNSPTKKGIFSFDVKATSFEFSFRPQQKIRRQNDFYEPKIQEIVERDSSDNQNSLHLEDMEHSQVKDSYVSDVPSIEIKMDEYQSSDDDDDADSEVNIGLTFYKDLMNQVNNVLKKVKKSECHLSANKRAEYTSECMSAVKQATLQHLKNIGVNLSPIQESSEVSKESELDLNNPSEISCAVQQLLMKYLPQDKLAKAIQKPTEQKPKDKKLKMKGKTPPSGEFSFATLQYMKKYNILDNSKKLQEQSPKILDVTALKMQPKLL